jgi:uncharacterized delta-60 repeat protein
MGGRGWLLVLAVLAGGLSVERAAHAAIGDLDASFGDGGLILTQLGQGAMPVSEAIDVKLRPNGKIFVAGAASDSMGNLAGTLARYLPAGTFDPTFGTGGSGIVKTQFGGGATPSTIFFYSGLALQPDGAIVGCGASTDASGKTSVLVARYTSAGVLDASFASGGRFLQQFGLAASPTSNLFGCKIQSDGKIVGVGGRNDAMGNIEALVIRLDSAGVPDPTFASGGVFAQNLSPSPTTPVSVAIDLVFQADGKAVVSLGCEDAADNVSTAITRLTTGGVIDPLFGTAGLTITDFGGLSPLSEGLQISMQSTGKFIVTGDGEDSTGNRAFLSARYTAGGMLDPSYGNGGKKTVQPSPAATPSSIGLAQILQGDDKIIIAGSSLELDGTTALTIVRLTSEGDLDPTFAGGIVKKQFGTGATAFTNAIGGAMTQTGKLIVAGTAGTNSSTGLSWWVASFEADNPPTASFTVAPGAPSVGDAVTLDGSGSSDSDGTIKRYDWDLDGDGEYDDASGVTTFTSFATAGSHNVGLRVTDNVDAQGTSVVAVPVGCGTAASYASIDCRIAGLQASVDAQVPAGATHDKLATALSTARSLEQAAQAAGPGKTAKKNLTKAGKQIGKFMGGVRKGKKTIPADLRTALLDVAKGVKSAIKQLKKHS